ncbi:N-acyl-D-amino-acid deacylase [Gammaproteobacteria bacterium ESL0073]|nr:N-acyl-D-amino-acid deacylase [Gammaproteobacteria bacterium ESL0073]
MDTIIRNVRIDDSKPLVDVAITNGKITAIQEQIEATAALEIQGNKHVLVPSFVESHLHLEKAFVMDRKANRSGTLQEAIAVTAELKPTFTQDDIMERSRRVIRLLVQNGSTHVRAHAEFDPGQGFTGFDAVLKLREEFKDVISIQVVAFPQEGIFKYPGTEAMMVEAMEKGADVVGGIPYNDRDAKEHIDFVFNLAKKYDKDIDLHQDFADNADKISIDYVAQKTIEMGWQGRVSVGHLTSLAALEPDRRNEIIKLIKEADISVMCLPATDLHLGARNDTYNIRRTLTPVRALRDAGVNVCLATNNIRNAFTPYGTGNLLHISMLAIPAAHLGGADDQLTVLPMLTTNPAKALGLKNYGLEVGKDADLVLLNTDKISSVILDIPVPLKVFKRGKVVAETEINQQLKF